MSANWKKGLFIKTDLIVTNTCNYSGLNQHPLTMTNTSGQHGHNTTAPSHSHTHTHTDTETQLPPKGCATRCHSLLHPLGSTING